MHSRTVISGYRHPSGYFWANPDAPSRYTATDCLVPLNYRYERNLSLEYYLDKSSFVSPKPKAELMLNSVK